MAHGGRTTDLGSEAFSAPNDVQTSKGAQFIDTYHGYSGPVGVTFPEPSAMYGGPQQSSFISTIQGLIGIKHDKDLNGGTPNCVSITPITVNWRDQGHRASAPEAYYTPVENARPNWLILTKHQVTKINWSGASIPLTASGVEFAPASGGSARYVAFARREVIIAAGAIQTPALLQLSGIGDSAVLGPLGIQTRINLKTVGRNLQEQPMSALGATGTDFDVGGRGPPDVIAYPNLSQVFGSQANTMAQKIFANIPSWAKSQVQGGLNEEALKTIFGVQADLIVNKNDIDMDIQVATARLSRKILTTPPLSDLTKGEQIPGNAVPDGAQRGTDAAWKAWIQKNYVSVAHPIGTAAMMRRSLGELGLIVFGYTGVVNAQLKVYDTTNVRVVDASIMPMQISAHLSATLYGVAEKAAYLIKASQ
ncbi:hypothetical protein C0989_010724 [Termitomyces sp. Mn162]|nr:hypothetical protein C0989_010724 [Termitomyces sp. Mn162]